MASLLVRATAGVAFATLVFMLLRALTLIFSYYSLLYEYRRRKECTHQ